MKIIPALLVIDTPETGDTFTAANDKIAIPITWEDDDNSPTSDEIKYYTFKLCTGANNDIQGLQTILNISPDSINDNSYTPTFKSNVGKDGLYYVQIYLTYKNGGYAIRYTNRISLEGMTGTIVPSGTGAQPGDVTDDGSDSQINQQLISKSFTVPYTLQTGKTRYAPMQMQPGSSVTAKTWSRKFPSSSVTYYSTFGNAPNVLSTVTPGWSYTMSSLINYATPAPFPNEVSWYPASVRLVSATIDPKLASGNSKNKLKKRRWID